MWNVMVIWSKKLSNTGCQLRDFHGWYKYLWQRRKELFPIPFNYSGPLDWCEWHQKYKYELLGNAFPLTVLPMHNLAFKSMLILYHMNSICIYMVVKENNNRILQTKWTEYTVIYISYNMYESVFYISWILYWKNIFLKHFIFM